MGGAAIQLKTDDQGVKRLVGGLLTRLSNQEPAMKIIGNIVRTSIIRNFEVGGRPQKWKSLDPKTKKRKKSNHVLRERGMACSPHAWG
ncbi:MAG: hypothetical protein SV775_13875 [Thermodesulfobacteriota bacterium]|nr:hypothetical protein [Thermodesulfobacteriota bacterium]